MKLTCCIVYIKLILSLYWGNTPVTNFQYQKSVTKFDVLNITLLKHISDDPAWFDVAWILNVGVPSVAAILTLTGVPAVDAIPYIADVPAVTVIFDFVVTSAVPAVLVITGIPIFAVFL